MFHQAVFLEGNHFYVSIFTWGKTKPIHLNYLRGLRLKVREQCLDQVAYNKVEQKHYSVGVEKMISLLQSETLYPGKVG